MKDILGSLQLNRIYQMDCLEGMKLIPDKSINMILCDLPYGTTSISWDSIIPLKPLWEQYERITKDSGAIVLFGSQPFTSKLIMSNEKMFRYEIIWNKVSATGFLDAKKRPLKSHENILVFYKKLPIYNPQFEDGQPYKKPKRTKHFEGYRDDLKNPESINESGKRYPKSILTISNANQRGKIHPTQKPVSLFEWLIKTYTNENEIVLDNCIGSGTTAVAATLNNRNWIGFETDHTYFELANKRLDEIELHNDLNIL